MQINVEPIHFKMLSNTIIYIMECAYAIIYSMACGVFFLYTKLQIFPNIVYFIRRNRGDSDDNLINSYRCRIHNQETDLMYLISGVY